jgi:AraC-like DNA-binding protein
LECLWSFEPHGELEEAEAVAAAGSLLLSASGHPENTGRLPVERLARVRDLIASCPQRAVSAEELERASGLDRWALARGFRRLYGTSPSRFRTMRQIDLVKRALWSGKSLVEAALLGGFADQSHMSRQFKRSIGFSPGAWVAHFRNGAFARGTDNKP